jgi:hypothetical protein
MERVWGSPWDMERAPRKLGWWGCETSRGKRGTQTHDVGFQFPTVYTYTLQYLLHFDYEAFGKVSDCHNGAKTSIAHQDDTQVLQVQCDRNDPDIQTCPHRRSGT